MHKCLIILKTENFSGQVALVKGFMHPLQSIRIVSTKDVCKGGMVVTFESCLVRSVLDVMEDTPWLEMSKIFESAI